MLSDLGSIVLILALAMAIYTAIGSVVGARRRLPELMASAENGVLAVTALTFLAIALLVYAFWTHDFQIEYVAQNSNRAMPRYLLLTSLWGGQAGSLLFWSGLLSLYSAAVVLVNRGRHRDLMPYAIAVLAGTQAFFLLLVTVVNSPFTRLPFVPADGIGMNPLLRHPAMALHPPNLYLGFTGLTVPFAFAMAALASRQLDARWIQLTRRWTLIAWLFLSMGILLGGRWAYDVLGWGGYWGWDPVENSSLMPWLTATAFIHSVMVQERKGMLKVWNMVLIILTYGLMLFGTFITRSGIVQSVHAFAQSDIGPFFLGFISLTFLGSVALLFDRLGDLKSRQEMTSLVSREAFFLLQNLLFVCAAFVVFWGTIFPMISEIVTGDKITVGPPFFNTVAGPIFGAIVLVMGVIPLIGWSGATPARLARNLIPGLVVTALGLVALMVMGIRLPIALAGFGLVIFSGFTTLSEFVRGALARHRSTGENYLRALVNLIARNRRRYGGYLVHAAIVLMALGIVGSSVYKLEETATLRRGESMQVGPYTLTYQGLTQVVQGDKQSTRASLIATENGNPIGVLTPIRDFYPVAQQPMTIPYVRTTAKEDLYIILNTWDEGGEVATFKVTVNPLTVWIWFGGLLFVAATLLALWPGPRRKPVPAQVPVPRRGPRVSAA